MQAIARFRKPLVFVLGFAIFPLLWVVTARTRSSPTPPAHEAPSAMPSDSEIRQILVDRIDVQHQSVGIVVGIVGPAGRRMISYGHLDENDPRPLQWRHDL